MSALALRRRPGTTKLGLVVVAAVAIAVAAVQATTLFGSAGASGAYRYDAYGEYLDLGWPAAAKPCCLRDANGIPLVDYGGKIGRRYNPFDVAADGLTYFSSALYNGDASYLEQAVRDANWLVRHQQSDGRWLYHFRLVEYFISPPWPSALAQGAALSLLVRVWRYTGDIVYLTTAKRALLPYSRPAWKGGVLTYWGTLPFYEEAPRADPPFILNGFMSALIGLHDMASAEPRSSAPRLYRRGLQTLMTLLPLYDYGDGQSIYNLQYVTAPNQPKSPASTWYQGRHVVDLAAIESVSPSPVLEHYLDAWSVHGSRRDAPLQIPRRRFVQLWRTPAVQSLLVGGRRS